MATVGRLFDYAHPRHAWGWHRLRDTPLLVTRSCWYSRLLEAVPASQTLLWPRKTLVFVCVDAPIFAFRDCLLAEKRA
jgi:hypothetical protein